MKLILLFWQNQALHHVKTIASRLNRLQTSIFKFYFQVAIIINAFDQTLNGFSVMIQNLDRLVLM